MGSAMPGIVRGILLGAPYLYGSSGSTSNPSFGEEEACQGKKGEEVSKSSGFQSPALEHFMGNLALNYSTTQLVLEVIALVEFVEVPLVCRGVVFLSPALVALTSVGENYLPEDWAKRSVELRANVMNTNETICMGASITSSVALIVFGQPVTGGVALAFVVVSLVRKNMQDCTYTELALKLAPYAVLAIGTAGVTTFFMPVAAGLFTQAVAGGGVTQLATGVGATAVSALFDAVAKRVNSGDSSSSSSVLKGKVIAETGTDDKSRSLNERPSIPDLAQIWKEVEEDAQLESVWAVAQSQTGSHPKVVAQRLDLVGLMELSQAWEEASEDTKMKNARALADSSEYSIDEDVLEQFREALKAATREAEEKAAEALRIEEERKAQETERLRESEALRVIALERQQAIAADRKKPILERNFFGSRL